MLVMIGACRAETDMKVKRVNVIWYKTGSTFVEMTEDLNDLLGKMSPYYFSLAKSNLALLYLYALLDCYQTLIHKGL